MSPVTHFLLSWLVADHFVRKDSPRSERDIALITAAGVLPDADGVGLFIDIANLSLGCNEAFSYYHAYHHWYAHGIFASLCIASLMAAVAVDKRRVFLVSLLTFHLHLVCDLLGSRGPDPGDVWTVFYLGPFSRKMNWFWNGQWRLDGWQNVTLSMLALGWVFWRAWRWGRSPLSLLSPGVHGGFVDTLRRRFGQPTGCGNTTLPDRDA